MNKTVSNLKNEMSLKEIKTYTHEKITFQVYKTENQDIKSNDNLEKAEFSAKRWGHESLQKAGWV